MLVNVAYLASKPDYGLTGVNVSHCCIYPQSLAMDLLGSMLVNVAYLASKPGYGLTGVNVAYLASKPGYGLTGVNVSQCCIFSLKA